MTHALKHAPKPCNYFRLALSDQSSPRPSQRRPAVSREQKPSARAPVHRGCSLVIRRLVVRGVNV